MNDKWTHLHSGSNVKLLTLAAAAKQPSILPSPEQRRNSHSWTKILSTSTLWDVPAELLKVETAGGV